MKRLDIREKKALDSTLDRLHEQEPLLVMEEERQCESHVDSRTRREVGEETVEPVFA